MELLFALAAIMVPLISLPVLFPERVQTAARNAAQGSE